MNRRDANGSQEAVRLGVQRGRTGVLPRLSLKLAVLLGFLGVLAGCEDRPPPSFPPAEAARLTAEPLLTAPVEPPSEKPEARRQGVPPGALDIPNGGCPSLESHPDAICAAARALPTALTHIPTKLNGLLPLPGGKVHNRSTRDIFAIGSLPGVGSWEIVRVPAGASLGGDIFGGAAHTTTDVDWVSATPPTPGERSGFSYDPAAIGVKIVDGAELTVDDLPGGGVRFWLSAEGAFPSQIRSAGQMNSGSAILYVPPK